MFFNPPCANVNKAVAPDGIRDMIPTNTIIDIPLPIPYSVTLSPNQVSKAVPATSEVMNNINPITAPAPKVSSGNK